MFSARPLLSRSHALAEDGAVPDEISHELWRPISREFTDPDDSEEVMMRITGDSECLEGSHQANLAVSACNRFGIDLYRRLAREDDHNLLLSPYSILSALAGIAEGARGHTAREMREALNLPESLEAVHAGIAALSRRLTTSEDHREMERLRREIESLRGRPDANQGRKRVAPRRRDRGPVADDEQELVDRLNLLVWTMDRATLEVANVLWIERSCQLSESFVSTLTHWYGPDLLQQADFRNDFERERLRINEWARKETRDRVQELLPSGSLSALTRLVLANTVYFKGDWQSPFVAKQTHDGDFFLSDDVRTKVPLMRQCPLGGARYGAFNPDGTIFKTPDALPEDDDATPRYPAEDGFAIVELPYRGGEFAMVVLLPNRTDGLPEFESRLDSETLARWIGQLRSREIDLYLPRFHAETEYKLNTTLAAMGMRSAFENPVLPGGADFRGMSDSEDPNNRSCISLIRHQAFVKVDETGTEAAASTVAELDTCSRRMRAFRPIFRADRPFLYLIRDIETGCMLFLGRTTRP